MGSAKTTPMVPCKWCRTGTPMLGTEKCDRCWELEKRIERDPALAGQMAQQILGMVRYAEFERETAARDAGNLEKWGIQSKLRLIAALTEEVGEVAQATCDGLDFCHKETGRTRLTPRDVRRLRSEIIDAAALLRRLYDQADEPDPAGAVEDPDDE